MKTVKIYEGNKKICYIKNLSIDNGVAWVETDYKLIKQQPSEFYFNVFHVLVGIDGNLVLSASEADSYLKHVIKTNPEAEGLENICCPCVSPEELKYSRTIPAKELRKIKKEYRAKRKNK